MDRGGGIDCIAPVSRASFCCRPSLRGAMPPGLRHSGMVRQHQTRNLEIPGSMLRIAPE